MPTIHDAELRITRVAPSVNAWLVEVTWVAVVPYWEVGSWWREIVELRAGGPGQEGAAVLRWRCDPWQVAVEGKPPDGTNHRIKRAVPAQLAGPNVLDVAPDAAIANVVLTTYPSPMVRIDLGVDRRLDVLHAAVTMAPVSLTPCGVLTPAVTGQFGGVS